MRESTAQDTSWTLPSSSLATPTWSLPRSQRYREGGGGGGEERKGEGKGKKKVGERGREGE